MLRKIATLPLTDGIADCWVVDKIALRRQQSREQCVTNWLQEPRIRPAGRSMASILAMYAYRDLVASVRLGEETGRGVDAGAATGLRNRVVGEIKRKSHSRTEIPVQIEPPQTESFPIGSNRQRHPASLQ